MLSKPAPGDRWDRAAGSLRLVAVACVTASLVGLLLVALREYPDSFVDEVLYVEPAIALAVSGVPRLPSVAPHLAEKGAPGLGERSWMLPHASLWPRSAGVTVFGSDLRGLRLKDLVLKVLACVAFGFAVYRWKVAPMEIWAVAAFLGHASVAWAQPGRPDLMALAFGLLGIGMLGGGARGCALGGIRCVHGLGVCHPSLWRVVLGRYRFCTFGLPQKFGALAAVRGGVPAAVSRDFRCRVGADASRRT